VFQSGGQGRGVEAAHFGRDHTVESVRWCIEMPNEQDKAVLRFLFTKYKMARPLLAPPEIPPERLAILRKGFADTMQDADFRADAAKAGLDINPVSGEEIAKLVAGLNATPAAVVARTRMLLGQPAR